MSLVGDRIRRRGVAGVAALSAMLAVATYAAAAPAAQTRPADSGSAEDVCTPRLLVLSAFPAELDALLVKARFGTNPTVMVDGRPYYVGTLGGNDVVMTLTGIGPVNATATTTAALDHFRCNGVSNITGIVFSGVAGSRFYIGDVTVPARWTLDDGKTWYHVDPTMLQIARGVAQSGSVKLEQDAPVGDPSCACKDPGLVTVAHIDHTPQIILGGDGVTTDPVGGRALFCVPSGGDVFGCEPCRAPTHSTPDAQRFVKGVAPFVDPNFFLGEFSSPPASTTSADASDEETAAVAKVATTHATPFIAFRSVSDGQGDPLHLPGFPAQFFVYRQISADNAAAVAGAFLAAWSQRQAGDANDNNNSNGSSNSSGSNNSNKGTTVSAASAGGDASAVVVLESPNTAAAPGAPPWFALAALIAACALARVHRRRVTG